MDNAMTEVDVRLAGPIVGVAEISRQLRDLGVLVAAGAIWPDAERVGHGTRTIAVLVPVDDPPVKPS